MHDSVFDHLLRDDAAAVVALVRVGAYWGACADLQDDETARRAMIVTERRFFAAAHDAMLGKPLWCELCGDDMTAGDAFIVLADVETTVSTHPAECDDVPLIACAACTRETHNVYGRLCELTDDRRLRQPRDPARSTL